MSHNRRLIHLNLSCPDQPGIIAKISAWVHGQGGNIVSLDEYVSPADGVTTTAPSSAANEASHSNTGRLLMRLVFVLPYKDEEADHSDAPSMASLRQNFADQLGASIAAEATLRDTADRPRLAVLVSKHSHVLREILWHHEEGCLPAQLSCVISNHEDCRTMVENAGVAYHHVPFTRDNRDEAEAAICEHFAAAGGIDVVVLARFMQIVSPTLIDRYRHRIINIHHSFLPAFAGGMAYHQAYARGVKHIGATAHYVTADLDEGPIITQATMEVNHAYRALDLAQAGKDVERRVLMQALIHHLEDRVFVHEGKTVVFSRG